MLYNNLFLCLYNKNLILEVMIALSTYFLFMVSTYNLIVSCGLILSLSQILWKKVWLLLQPTI